MSVADNSKDIVHTWTYDSSKSYGVSSYTDPRGNTTTYTLNSAGQPTTVTFPAVTTQTPSVTITNTYAYNSDGTTASFTDDLNADSLDLVELIMAFEEEFDGGDEPR